MPLPAGNPSPSIPLLLPQPLSRPQNGLLIWLFSFAFFIASVFSSQTILAQDSFGSEKELKSQAEKFFKDDDYASALSLYSQLLSLYPSDPNYNYKFGVCLLYATENKEKPLSYLIFGVGKEGVEDEAYYHLGRAFHLNYRFDEAIVQYSLYKTKAGGKAAAKLDVDRQIAMCNNGKNLLRNVTDLVVMERKEMNASEYFRAYDLGGLDAKLVVKPDDLASSFDKKKKEKSTVVVRQTSQEIYYSSYGQDGKSGRDIFKITRLPNFQWSKEENLGNVINTPFDEDYPYITPDGKTLYFSSKGHNSMGGYDVFKSEWDEQSKTWSKPVNLDFAINTPDDDVQYVTDPKSDYGFFSSKRSVPDGKITVYKIKTERIPPTISAIRGQFNCDFKPPQFKARISIKNLENGKFVGTIGTNEKTGVYRVNLNNGNKYEYTVESPGYAPITQVVEIPTMTEQRPLRQEIQLKKVNGEDQVQILTFFADTAQDDASALARADWLKDKAMLDVNADQVLTEGSGSTVAQKKDLGPDRNAYVEADFSKLKLDNNQLLKIAKDDVAEAQKDLAGLEEKTEKAYALVDQKNKLAEEKNAEADKFEGEAEKIASGPLKEEKQSAVINAEKEANQLTNEARVAMSISRQLEEQTREASAELEQAKKYEVDLAKAIQSDSKDALKVLSEQGSKIQEENNAPEKESATAGSSEISNRELLISKMKAANQKTEKEIDELEQDQVNLAESLKTTKEDEQKASIQQELKEIEGQIKGKQRSIAQNNEKVATYQNEIDQAIGDERLAKQLNEQIESAPAANITPSEKAKIAQKTSTLVSNLPAASSTAIVSSNTKEENNSANTIAELAKVEPKVENQNKTENVEQPNKAVEQNTSNELAVNKTNEAITTETPKTTAEVSQVKEEKVNESNLTEQVAVNEKVESSNGPDGNNPAVAKLQQANRINARIDSLSSAISTETDEAKVGAMIAESKALKEQELQLKVEGKTAAMQFAKETGTAQVARFKDKLESNNRVSENRVDLVTKDINELQDRIERADEYMVKAEAASNPYEKDSLLTLSVNFMSTAERKMNEIHLGNVDLFDAPTGLLPNLDVVLPEQATSVAAASDKPVQQSKIAKATEEVRNNAIVKQYEPSMNYDANLKLSKAEVEEVKSTSAYIQFESLLNKSQEYISEGRKQALISEEIRGRGQNKLMESQSLIELAAEENNKKKQQLLAENAIDVDREGKDLVQDADSVKNIAVKEMRKAGAIKNEAEKVLNKVSKFERDQIIAAYVQPEITQEEKPVVATNQKVEPESKADQQENNAENAKSESSVESPKNETLATAQKQAEPDKNIEPLATQTPNKQEEEKSTKAEGATENVQAKKAKEDVVVANTNTQNNASIEEPEPSTKNQVKESAKTTNANTSKNASGNTNSAAAKTAVQLIAEEKKTSRYVAYSNFKDKVTAQEEKSKSFSLQADSILQQATIAENNSTDLLEFAAAQRDKRKRNEAQKKAMVFDEESRILKEEASKFRTQSDAAKLESMRMQSSADSVLKVSGEERASRMRMAYNNVVPVEETVVAQANLGNQNADTKVEKSVQENAVKMENVGANNVAPVLNKQKETTEVEEQKEVEEAKENQALVSAKAEKVEQKERKTSEINSNDKKNAAKKELSIEQSNSNENLAKENSSETKQSNQESLTPKLPPVHKTTEYITYRNLMNQSDSLNKEAEVFAKKSETIRAESDRSYEESNTLLEQAAAAKKKDRKALIEQATESENNAVRLRNEADSLSTRGNELKAMARTKENAANITLGKVDGSMATRIVSTYKGLEDTTALVAAVSEPIETQQQEQGASQTKESKEEKTSQVIANNKIGKVEGISSERKVPGRSNTFNDSFSTSAGVNASNQIPMNPELPSGIVYKVQIGAFKRPLPGNAFGTVSPVAGETTNSGWIRYTAGLFSAFNKALGAKTELNGRGFNDAFVVAYCNGQRISVSKAREMERNGTSCDGGAVIAKVEPGNAPIENEVVGANVSNTSTNKVVLSPTASEAGAIAPGAVLPQTGLSEVKGLVYTIQIGVYRKMVTAGQLYNIQPLYYEQLDNGLYRYTTGVYNNLKDAGEAKNIAVGFGISDAFVTAYRGGKRISMDQAAVLVAQNGQSVFDQREGMNKMPNQLRIGTAAVQQKREEAPAKVETPKIDVTKKGGNQTSTNVDLSQLFFKVQLGAFRNEVPVEVLNKYLAMAGKGISNIKSEDGLTIYMVGSFSNREEAQRLKESVVADGIPDAFVVAVYQGKRITMEEATQLIQNK
jgi:epidermal growth factor receptor substrate 15